MSGEVSNQPLHLMRWLHTRDGKILLQHRELLYFERRGEQLIFQYSPWTDIPDEAQA